MSAWTAMVMWWLSIDLVAQLLVGLTQEHGFNAVRLLVTFLLLAAGVIAGAGWTW